MIDPEIERIKKLPKKDRRGALLKWLDNAKKEIICLTDDSFMDTPIDFPFGPIPHWIKCSDTLPEAEGFYLCAGAAIEWSMDENVPDAICIAYFNKEKKDWVERTRRYEDILVTHWMPLPKPPNE